MTARQRDRWLVALGTLAVFGGWLWLIRGHAARRDWPGVDDAVIGRFVIAAGSEPRPLLDWVRGDTLLFAFLIAGIASGFVLGFFARAVLRRDGRPS
jgi:hypothetical protein